MRLQFILSEIGIGLRRNLAMTISLVIVTAVTMLFVGGAFLLQRQVATVQDFWYDKVQVSIFLCTPDSEAPTCASGEPSAAVREQIKDDLESPALEPYVEEVFYESKADAFKRFQEDYKDSAIVDNVTEDQMPESYRVKLEDPEKFQVVSQFFTGREGIEEVQDQRELLDRFFAILNFATLIAVCIAALMLVAAVLLLATTIRLAAFNRRRETGIMRLVGASNSMLQLPFMLEGVIAVVLGAVVSVAGLWAIVRYFVEGFLAKELPIFEYIGTGEVWVVAPILFVIGILLAGVSSVITLSRYLKV